MDAGQPARHDGRIDGLERSLDLTLKTQVEQGRHFHRALDAQRRQSDELCAKVVELERDIQGLRGARAFVDETRPKREVLGRDHASHRRIADGMQGFVREAEGQILRLQEQGCLLSRGLEEAIATIDQFGQTSASRSELGQLGVSVSSSIASVRGFHDRLSLIEDHKTSKAEKSMAQQPGQRRHLESLEDLEILPSDVSIAFASVSLRFGSDSDGRPQPGGIATMPFGLTMSATEVRGASSQTAASVPPAAQVRVRCAQLCLAQDGAQTHSADLLSYLDAIFRDSPHGGAGRGQGGSSPYLGEGGRGAPGHDADGGRRPDEREEGAARAQGDDLHWIDRLFDDACDTDRPPDNTRTLPTGGDRRHAAEHHPESRRRRPDEGTTPQCGTAAQGSIAQQLVLQQNLELGGCELQRELLLEREVALQGAPPADPTRSSLYVGSLQTTW